MTRSTSRTSSIEVTAPTRDKALHEARDRLGVALEDCDVEVVRRGWAGFLGWFGRSWTLRVFAPDRSGHDGLREAAIEDALRAAEAVDGSFELDVDNRRILLTVHPPNELGEPVAYGEVEQHLRRLGLDYCDFGRVRTAVRQSEGTPARIGQLPPRRRSTATSRRMSPRMNSGPGSESVHPGSGAGPRPSGTPNGPCTRRGSPRGSTRRPCAR